MLGILQVLPLRKSDDNVLKCHRKKRTLRGRKTDFPRMQSVEWKPRRRVLNSTRQFENV
jgi:hypothetical protein